MSRENVEIIRKSFERLSRSREEAEQAGKSWYPWVDAWLRQFFHPEVQWRCLAEEPDAEVYRGYDGVRRLFDDWVDNFADLTTEAEEFIDAGEYVVVPAKLQGLGRASGIEVELPDTFVLKMHEGKVIEVREYSDTADALAAAGLSEDAPAGS
jgi:ketosteroid isomerase-like protein